MNEVSMLLEDGFECDDLEGMIINNMCEQINLNNFCDNGKKFGFRWRKCFIFKGKFLYSYIVFISMVICNVED